MLWKHHSASVTACKQVLAEDLVSLSPPATTYLSHLILVSSCLPSVIVFLNTTCLQIRCTPVFWKTYLRDGKLIYYFVFVFVFMRSDRISGLVVIPCQVAELACVSQLDVFCNLPYSVLVCSTDWLCLVAVLEFCSSISVATIIWRWMTIWRTENQVLDKTEWKCLGHFWYVEAGAQGWDIVKIMCLNGPRGMQKGEWMWKITYS